MNSPPLPPGPTPWPFLGNIPHMIGPAPHVTLAEFAKIYGPIISLKLGTQCLIVGSSPDVAKEIFKINDRIFSGRYVPQSIPLSRFDLNRKSFVWADECNDNWKFLRATCSGKLFSNKAMKSQSLNTEKIIKDLISFLRARDQDEVVKIADVVFVTNFNIMGNAFMSRDFISLDGQNECLKNVIKTGVEATAAPNLADCYPFLSELDLQGLRKTTQDFTIKMKKIWEPIIGKRRRKENGPGGHQDFLDTLIHKKFTNDRIDILFSELFAGGTDTMTASIEWTMAELLKNPECMKKTRAEIESEINKGFPKNFDSMHLPYLQACIKETLRLHPPTPFSLPHRAIAMCQVMNYTVPQDAQVLLNLWAISRDPSVWKRPLKFRPERFLGSDIDFKGNNFEFLPFGAGRRICPGIPLATKNIPLILVALIHFFDWSLPDGNNFMELNMSEKFGATMDMKHHLMLHVKARREHDCEGFASCTICTL